MLLPADLHGRTLGHEYCGPRLEERLHQYRRFDEGIAVSLVGWNGFRFERMSGALPSETLGFLNPAGLPR